MFNAGSTPTKATAESSECALVNAVAGMHDDRPRLVWSEVADMMSISPGIHTLDDLIAALEEYRDDPPEPNPPRRGLHA